MKASSSGLQAVVGRDSLLFWGLTPGKAHQWAGRRGEDMGVFWGKNKPPRYSFPLTPSLLPSISTESLPTGPSPHRGGPGSLELAGLSPRFCPSFTLWPSASHMMSLNLNVPSECPWLVLWGQGFEHHCCVRPSPKRSFLRAVGDGDVGWEEAAGREEDKAG